MTQRFVRCSVWMQEFLQKHAVLRSRVNFSKGEFEVNLFSLNTSGRLLCFTYSSLSYPSSDTFVTTPIEGPDLYWQARELCTNWENLGLDFWATEAQVNAFEQYDNTISPINAYSLDMMFAYQRLLACLETHPIMPGLEIADVILAHKRLAGLLDEQSRKIQQALESLSMLTKK